ncbi:DUF937 domain-containing protein [cf. Phormidesmis sp. LEGE 11477]|uniref:DUF937 domain-containing protein n=1 Tax=cf. Phormidesmis sp. LEGE 11477 TaxID=1828680 RepID=UPI00187EE4AB|nr:DUF937 domain-containing protein [cf. Phormidesmis sp. LEGE 11477]MBE9060424.1 DUF937 domain-containing protein [cf. Phormidesmis sp. LEGE 11477]
MGLFDQVMKAVADPSRQANVGQLSQILGAAKQIANENNADADTMKQAMSVIGGFVRSSLNDTRQAQGDDAAQSLIEEGSANGAAVIPKLFNNAQLTEMVSTVTQRTNLNTNQVQGILPMVLPLVMQFLSSGNAKGGATQTGSNPILTAFLDSDSDGDVDMGDMLGMASKFM